MAHIDNIRLIAGYGMNFEDSPQFFKDFYASAFNLRVTGTTENESGSASNPESNTLISGSLPSGICKGIGGMSAEDVGYVIYARYNTHGNNQIVVYNSVLKTETVIYEDKTDSAGLQLLPWDPQNYVKFILVNETYLVGVATGNEVFYTNLNTLMNGGYGTVLAEDLSLLKPQCLIPPTGLYGSDFGQPANYLYGKLPQFSLNYINADFNPSTWSTWSKRIVPYQQNTPTTGQDVTQNNYIVVSVNIGSIRATTINIACRFGLDDFSIVKSVDRAYVLALPSTTVAVDLEIYEAYDPATNLYSFAFYNNTISIPVLATETDLPYSYVWPSNAIALINGNIIALADLLVGYPRPNTSVTISAIGYNPNIAIPAGTYGDPLTAGQSFPGESGSGAGNHKRNMYITISGTPHTGDIVVIIQADIRNATNTINNSYTVPSSQDGNLLAVVTSISQVLNGSFAASGSGYRIFWTGQPYFGLQTFSVELFFSGALVANSVPTGLDNTVYQFALSYRDGSNTIVGGRWFPLCTGNKYIVPTPSFAQINISGSSAVNANTIQFTWHINDIDAPTGAIDYQWMITKPAPNKILETNSCLITYKGAWNAKTNTPTLQVNSGNIGDAYQITTPASPDDTANYHNLGTNAPYKTGDYIVNVGGTTGGGAIGQYYEVLPRSYGNIAGVNQPGTGTILVFSINSLALLNAQYSDQNVNTNLVYDYAVGDRCTLQWWLAGDGNRNYFNSPCIDLAVLGYDPATYLVKVENTVAFTYDGSGNVLYNGNEINAKNIFIRLYSPGLQNGSTSATQNETVWYEIGERFTITNGQHDVLNGIITDGGAYFKTRQFPDAILPYANYPVNVVATDLNYSDFYSSAYSSFGRPRTYNDELEKTERKAITITGGKYITGSRINKLTLFNPLDIYGETDGETSSSYGAIQFLWQRGDVLVIGQELNVFYSPVNITYTQLSPGQQQESISQKLLNNGRYETIGRGIGKLKEAFCYNEGTGWMVDPNYGDIFELTVGGVISISGKMNKYLKRVIPLAYANDYKIVLFYNRYYDELMVCIEALGGILTFFAFNATDWNPFNNITITPGNVSATPNGSHSTASYNSMTGIITYTPATDYVGADSATFSFTPAGGSLTTVKNCLSWTAGDSTVNAFSFTPRTGQPLSTYIQSINSITVSGPNVPVAISISGASGQYSKNGGAFTSAPGTAVAGDVIQVENMSSASNSTDTTTTLTIGATSGTFDVTTLAASAWHFTADAQYGLSIVNISGSGVPGAFTPCNITPGNSLSAAYTSASGAIQVTVTGSPVLPAQLVLYVAGVDVSHVNVPFAANYNLTFPSPATNPTTVRISVNLQ